MDTMKVMYSILKEIEDGNTKFNQNDFKISQEQFFNVLEIIEDNKYIKGAKFPRGKGNRICMAILDNSRLTLEGIKFLQENSNWAKTYKGIKEFASWIPFVNLGGND